MYPLLSKLSAPSTLCPQLRTILLAAGHVAAGDAAATTAAFRYIDAVNIPKAYDLCILQAAPLVGIPRALHSAAALQAAGIVGDGSSNRREKSESEWSLRSRGAATFAKVYGRNSERVRRRLAEFHPELEGWIVGHVYGVLFAGEGCSLRERELAAVAVLCGDACAAAQLASHLRGALNAGASREEVGAVVGWAGAVHGEREAECARACWERFERGRWAL